MLYGLFIFTLVINHELTFDLIFTLFVCSW